MKRTGLTHFAFGYPRAGNDQATFHDCSFPEPVEGNNALNCVSPRGEGLKQKDESRNRKDER